MAIRGCFIGTRGTEQAAYEVRAKQILVLTPKPPDESNGLGL